MAFLSCVSGLGLGVDNYVPWWYCVQLSLRNIHSMNILNNLFCWGNSFNVEAV